MPARPAAARTAPPAAAARGLDRAAFFAIVRRENFGGKLKQSQVDGLNAILDYHAANWPGMIDEELAYVLATAQWESGHSMQPIEEGYPLRGDRLRAFQRRLRYFPWYGRGLVQITWEDNYRKFGLIPAERALEWPNALRALFEGMIFGRYRQGHKLADYFSKENQDPINGRYIINGRRKGEALPDRANEIAALYWDYLKALRAGRESAHEQPPAVDVRAAQERLAALGYAPGPIDGVLGQTSVGALAAFQFTNGLPVTGALDAATLLRLSADDAAPSALREARREATEADIPGSRTIEAADEAVGLGWRAMAAVLAFMAEENLSGLPALTQKGLRFAFAIFLLYAAWRVIAAARTVKLARLDDHRSGANLGR